VQRSVGLSTGASTAATVQGRQGHNGGSLAASSAGAYLHRPVLLYCIHAPAYYRFLTCHCRTLAHPCWRPSALRRFSGIKIASTRHRHSSGRHSRHQQIQGTHAQSAGARGYYMSLLSCTAPCVRSRSREGRRTMQRPTRRTRTSSEGAGEWLMQEGVVGHGSARQVTTGKLSARSTWG
jgi:hypothetical protein